MGCPVITTIEHWERATIVLGNPTNHAAVYYSQGLSKSVPKTSDSLYQPARNHHGIIDSGAWKASQRDAVASFRATDGTGGTVPLLSTSQYGLWSALP